MAGLAPRLLAILMLLAALGGCASRLEGGGYLWQSVSGHLDLLRRAQPIEQVISDPATDPALAEKLRYAQTARSFAVTELRLPDNGSYTRYSALARDHVLWNVFAAPELSLELERWCFPVAGCIGYRGYYDQADARAFADTLKARGLDVRVGGVPAYSTLGWFDDPLTSAMMRYPKSEVARIVFHELAHQIVYVKGDTTFNESFATAVERLGIERWLARAAARGEDQTERARYQDYQGRRLDFLALLRDTRAQLAALYADTSRDDSAKRRGKTAILAQMRERYEALKASRWQGWAGYDRWFEEPVGNAHLAAVGAYHDRVDAFIAMFMAAGEDFERFYVAVRALAELSAGARNAELDALQHKAEQVAGLRAGP
ncbi:MAG: aminopeptidase [Burkholderiaceae bacterium]